MSAFFLYLHNNRPLEEPELQSISKELSRFPWVKTTIYTNKALQLVYTINKDDKIRIFQHKEKNLVFFLQGNIFESQEGINRIEQNNEEYNIESQIIKRYLVGGGISTCVGLNGIYNLLVWSEKESMLEVAGDRLGVLQLFYASLGNNRSILTTDIIALKHIQDYKIKISKRGIFDILYMGVGFAGRTVLEAVDRLLPNAGYNIFREQLSLLKELKLPFSEKRWGYITPKILDELEYYYIQAIKRQLTPEDKIIDFQSGGRDSRLFSYFLKKANIIPHCISAGESHHQDVFLGKKVCKALGFPWERIPISQEFNVRYAEEFLSIDSFSGRIFSPWDLEIVEKVRSNYDYLVSAFIGDDIFGGEIEKGKLDKDDFTFEHFFQYYRQGFASGDELSKLFPKNYKDWIQEYKDDSFKMFERLGDKAYEKIMSYSLFNCTRSKIGGILRNINAALPVKLPCIDNDLMNFVFSLPPALLYKRAIIDIFLKQRTENLKQIPIDANTSDFYFLTASLKSQLRYKAWSELNKKIKLPILRFTNPISATTQFYCQAFSLKDRGFQRLKKQAISYLPYLEDILDISKAREIMERCLPNDDHIISGNTQRAFITAILIAKAFKT